MSAVMQIIIKATDKASEVAKKVGDLTKGQMEKIAQATDKARQAGDRFTGTTVKVGQSGQSAYAQLTQKQQEYINGLSKTQGLLDRVGLSGTQMGNTVLRGYDLIFNGANRVRQGVESLKQRLESTTVGSALITGFNTVKNKVVEVGNKIKESFSRGLDAAKTKVEQLNEKMGTLGTAVTSVFGALGLGSIYEATIGLAMTREQMTSLMTATMGSSSAAKEFTNYLNDMTNKSLVSLNDLGGAMSKIKMSTGMTNEQLKLISPTVNDIGQRAILMGRSTGEAQDLMVASFRGLNGEFDMLKTNFGITKQSLTDAGWSGAKTDVEGYNEALRKVLEKGGSMDGMLQTTPGQIALVKKAFSTAGREIGEIFIPAIQGVLGFMLELKKSNPIVFKLIIIFAALVSAFALMLPVLGAIIGSFKSFLVFMGLLQGAENATTLSTIRSTAARHLNTLSLKAQSAASYVAAAAMRVYAFATSGNVISTIRSTIAMIAQRAAMVAGTIATAAASAAMTLFNAVMNANPIMLVVIAIVALIGILWYFYNTNETVRNAINWLWDSLKQLGGYIVGGLTAAWNSLMTALAPIGAALQLLGGAILGRLQGAWNDLVTSLAPVISALSGLGGALSSLWNSLAGGSSSQASGIFSQIADAVKLVWSALSQLAGMVIEKIMPYLQMLWNFLSGAFSAVWTTVSGVIMAVINYIANFITILAQLISGNITAGQAIGMIWEQMKLLIFQILQSILIGVGTFAANLVQQAINAGMGFVNNIIMFITSLPGRLWLILLQAITMVLNWRNNLINHARAIATSIPNIILEGFRRIYSTGVGIFNQIRGAFDNMKNGLISAANSVKSAVWKPINDLWNSLKGFWGWITKPFSGPSGNAGPRPAAGGRYAGPRPSGGGSRPSAGGFFAGIANAAFEHTQMLSGYRPAGGYYAGSRGDIGDGNYPPECSIDNPCYAGPYDFSKAWIDDILSKAKSWQMNINGSMIDVGQLSQNGNLALFAQLAAKLIGPTGYDYYYNGKFSDREALARGRFNCWDGAEILIHLAQAMGLSASMAKGTWGADGHVWAVVNGIPFDTTAYQHGYGWTSPKVRGYSGPSYAPSFDEFSKEESGDDINLNGEITLKHEYDFKNIPDGLTADEIEELIKSTVKESPYDEGFLKLLIERLQVQLGRKRRVRGT